MKTVFFDRDGIVNIPPLEGEYVLSWETFAMAPAFPDILRAVTDLGYVSVVVTNQRCIKKGLVAAETVERMHERLRDCLLRKHGLKILDIRYCPHGPSDHCECRKPLPGMLQQAARKHGLDLQASWMIGDRWTDVEAGRRAGCRTILVNPAADIEGSKTDLRPDHTCPDMETLRERITEWLG